MRRPTADSPKARRRKPGPGWESRSWPNSSPRTSGRLKRGEVWWGQLDPPAGPRPVLLISRDRAYATRRSVTIAPITTRIRGIRVEVEVGPADRLVRPSVVNLDDITTVRMQVLVG